MSRKVLFGALTISVALVFAVPALAKSHDPQSRHKLVMSTHLGHRLRVTHRGAFSTVLKALPPQAVLTYQGYNCAVTVAYGSAGQHSFNTHTLDSTEFYIRYVVGTSTYASVTSNCVGALPAGKAHPSTIVTHTLTSCMQFNPFDQTKLIQGSGISTTFPDGLYSETCNTPNFQ